MRRHRSGSSPSPYRALSNQNGGGHGAGGIPDSMSLIRSFNVEATPTRPVRPSPLTASTIRDMPLDLVDRIRSFPLFQSASEDFLAAIGNHLRPQVHAAQDTILHEGEDARAMYWIVRGVVAVTSRDGEAVFAELKAGSFFGEIGVLMDVPRTASIVARTKCLLVVLKKEDLQTELPRFPEMEQAIRQEAQERLNILKKKRKESSHSDKSPPIGTSISREPVPGEVSTGEVGMIKEGSVHNSKKRKSPSPGAIEDPAAGSALGSGFVNVRKTLKEFPLFSTLPSDILHFLGLSAQPKTYSPFTDIVRQGAPGNDIFFIVRGEAEVVREPAKSEDPFRKMPRGSYITPRLKAGQYFGEVASLGLSEGRTASVRSITTVECLMIDGDALEELWKMCPPDIKLQVEETARKRYRKTDEDVDMNDVNMEQQRMSTWRIYETRRRNSLAPPTPQPDAPSPNVLNGRYQPLDTTPIRFGIPQWPSDSEEVPPKRARILPHRPLSMQTPSLPDKILVSALQLMSVGELVRLRVVSTHWRKVIEKDPGVCINADLSPYNRRVTDHNVRTVIGPFLGNRPEMIDISNCFHLTDEGFKSLWEQCGRNVKRWRMRSVWDVSANQILEMAENAKDLEEVDWSNCRKVGDNLLARVVGWVVPEPPPPPPQNKQVVISSSNARGRNQKQQTRPAANIPKPGTSWAPFRFLGLNRLCLADCTYLSDNAIVALVGAAKNLTHLDLSFCCALSDTSTEVVALGLPLLQELRLAFCGSAVSDASLQSVALHLNELQGISVRGCVRVTGNGVENLLDGCGRLTWVDVSQCRNLEGWIRTGGVARWGFDERGGNGLPSPSSSDDGDRPKLMARAMSMSKNPMGLNVGVPGRTMSFRRRTRKPVRFIVEKGTGVLR
ncbi:cyclic nucleotide-binding domain-containing protein [Verticillium alfalfae VaMs.102]|uniref:Cyclic nucleotide-binding domain-containing protein n=1 Tax=Verticillium alfalfae (strain VaMs.102 / ATCC MYA-4576 / FGSC 10136) TaxID=526221 RepID=C9SYI4_VERA1|nr:cyclic nucleotide-binding domain-containing protein [Verticillium alfalfae VaMs.102]EEY23849.1 cyclic nucleotide-binding domain-containing protein [Verticillium alfalfae VaMs.102]